MKKSAILILAALAALSPLSSGARTKVDLGSQARIRASLCGVRLSDVSDVSDKSDRSDATKQAAAPLSSPRVLRGFITIAPGHTADDVAAVGGVTVLRHRGDLAIVELDPAALEAVENSRAVAAFTAERRLAPKMDRVRALTGIDAIHSGTGLPQAYTGRGVIAGIVDGGFDPNHVNFKRPDGSSRIAKFTYFRPTQSGGYVEDTRYADYIPNIDTEDETTFHGTHTLGIMAGGYRGPVTVAEARNSFYADLKTVDNPYYGIACDADISLACGAMTDQYIALGVESILDYAFEQQKPAVVNLSLGSNAGPHDGSSTLSRYLDLASEMDPVVICVAAGNEGDMPIAITKRLTGSDRKVASFLYPAVKMTNYQNVRFGATYIYSDSPEQFEVQAIIVNKTRNAVAFRMPLEATDGAMKYWVTSADYQGDDTDVIAPTLAKYVEGYIGVGAMFDEVTGRYYAVVDCMCWDNTAGSNAAGNYIVGFQVTGSEGQRIDVYCDGVYNNFSSYGLAGYDDGMTDGTISDVATGRNTVVVGSYNSRDDWASLDRDIYGYGGIFTGNTVSPFSSWGNLVDGRQMPTVCAPGATVISSSNEYYLDAYQATEAERQADLKADGRRYSWHQCVGTSMACPVVAGSVALWLEADPTLRYADVQRIIAATAKVDDDVTADPSKAVQWGAGKFDAYAGLKEVLATASVIDIADGAGGELLVRDLGGRRIEVFDAPAAAVDVTVTDLQGRTVAAVSEAGNTATVDLSAHRPGIYIVSVSGRKPLKIALK